MSLFKSMAEEKFNKRLHKLNNTKEYVAKNAKLNQKLPQFYWQALCKHYAKTLAKAIAALIAFTIDYNVFGTYLSSLLSVTGKLDAKVAFQANQNLTWTTIITAIVGAFILAYIARLPWRFVSRQQYYAQLDLSKVSPINSESSQESDEKPNEKSTNNAKRKNKKRKHK